MSFNVAHVDSNNGHDIKLNTERINEIHSMAKLEIKGSSFYQNM